MSVGEHSNIGRIFFAVGFLLLMTLDVAHGVRKLCTGKKSRPGILVLQLRIQLHRIKL